MQSAFSPAPRLPRRRRTAALSGKLFIVSHVDYRILRPDLTRLQPGRLAGVPTLSCSHDFGVWVMLTGVMFRAASGARIWRGPVRHTPVTNLFAVLG